MAYRWTTANSAVKPHLQLNKKSTSYNNEHPSDGAAGAEETEASNKNTNGANDYHENCVVDDDLRDVESHVLQLGSRHLGKDALGHVSGRIWVDLGDDTEH